MGLKRIAKFTGLALVLIIIVAFAGMSLVMYDVMSYTATSSETLNPAGNVTGNALVVYDPGFTGNAKNAASVVASDLQAKGYKVNLAGIKSTNAVNNPEYDIIVVSGPVYAGKVSSSAQSYLDTLKTSKNTKIGVFTSGGVNDINDTALIQKEITLPAGSTIKIEDIKKVVNGKDLDNTAAKFVEALIN
ncbi:flavodoxin family protein [Methanobacterium sp.]|uniref:flavodoxin family protein n=1 Tax=Methanobacterium sp. TaxID=2164 RepID=UPI003C761BE1